MNKYFISAGLVASLMFSSCSEDMFDVPGHDATDLGVINLAGQISQECVTRANDDGFADGDVIGVYIVDYEGTQAGTLKSQGNRGDNVRHTFDEASYSWSSAYDIYWID